MRLLPNYEQAIIDIKKLRDYCLSSSHPTGKDKARVFHSALGMNISEAEVLKSQILFQIAQNEVVDGIMDKYGKRYTVPVRIRNLAYEAEVTTVWMVKEEEDFSRLITCYISD